MSTSPCAICSGGVGLDPGRMPTGPDGAFLLDGLKAGETYDLQLFGGVGVIGPGPTKKGIAAPAAGVEFVVEGTGRIEGSAVDGRTGQPLTAFEVSYQADRGGFGGVMRFGRRFGGWSGGAGEALRARTTRAVLHEHPPLLRFFYDQIERLYQLGDSIGRFFGQAAIGGDEGQPEEAEVLQFGQFVRAVPAGGQASVSYTHLTLPTSDLV